MLVFENEFLRITARQAESGEKSNSVLLSFTGIGHSMGGMHVQKPEFFGTGRSFDNILFISDKTRSWGNQLNFELMKEMVSPLVGERKVYSIGNSMGGFNAIIASHYLDTQKVISFAPQYSVNPEIVPWETRWKKYTSSIPRFHFESVLGFMNAVTKYCIFSGRIGPDYEQAKLFPVQDNIDHYLFHDFSHDLAHKLKEGGFLERAIKDCLDGNHDLSSYLDYARLSPLGH